MRRAAEQRAQREAAAARRRRIAAGAAVAVGTTVLFAESANAAVFTVTNNNDSGSGSLRDAVQQSNATSANDTITFDAGVTGSINLGSQIRIGNDAPNPSAGDLAIEGPGAATLQISGGNATRIFQAYDALNPGGALVISGLTLANGSADRGGAVNSLDRALTIRDSVLKSNAATTDGGALWTDGFSSTVTLENTTITGNTAGHNGGGWYNEDTATPVGSPGLQVKGSTISNNTAATNGGGVYLYDPDAPVLFQDTTISGNTASTGKGGGVYLYNIDGAADQTTFKNSTISGNTAATGGGGIYLYKVTLDLENSTIANNSVTGGGANGGGLKTGPAMTAVNLENDTISGNSAGANGAGARFTTPASMVNTVVAGNTGGGDISGNVTASFSLVGNDTGASITDGGHNIINQPAKLGPLADNGGPTKTMKPLTGSPVLDAGNSGITTDQRGKTRPVDLPNVAPGPGNQSDMGAFELQLVANATLPSISGTTTSGQTLTADKGTWDGQPDSFSYQWLRCDTAGNNCTNVGTDQDTYVLSDADVGSTIRVDVTATNAGSSDTKRSAKTATVAAIPINNTVAPSISGTTTSGQTLTADHGTWTGSPTDYSYQWLRCDTSGNNCNNVGTDQDTYVLSNADVGSTIRVDVTASNAVTSGGPTRSAKTATVAAIPINNTVAPSISGTTTSGQTLTADHGTWTGSPTDYSYQWLRCDTSGNNCTNIGSDQDTYVLSDSDIGSTIRVDVTASNAVTSGGPERSAKTAVIAAEAITNTTAPSVSGTTTSGETLTADHGTWSGHPDTYDYQWLRCDNAGNNCTNVGSNQDTYDLTDADIGSTIRVDVTASNSYASGGPDRSAATAQVKAQAIANTTLPSITGTTTPGQTLTADKGAWTGKPTGYSYQWLRCEAANPANCTNVGTDQDTYVLSAADSGSRIRVQVTASNASNSTSARSGATTVVSSKPAVTSAPAIKQLPVRPRVGMTLTAWHGGWSGGPTSFTYQWLRCDGDGNNCAPIGTDQDTYVMTEDDIGSRIRVDVTASNAAGTSDPVRTAPTQRVVAVGGPLEITDVKVDRRAGTAEITVSVPGPGRVRLNARGRVLGTKWVSVSTQGETVKLLAEPTSRAAKALRSGGSVITHPQAQFEPTAGRVKKAKTRVVLRLGR